MRTNFRMNSPKKRESIILLLCQQFVDTVPHRLKCEQNILAWLMTVAHHREILRRNNPVGCFVDACLYTKKTFVGNDNETFVVMTIGYCFSRCTAQRRLKREFSDRHNRTVPWRIVAYNFDSIPKQWIRQVFRIGRFPQAALKCPS